MEIRDLTGQKFSYLTVIRRADYPSKNVYWLCECTCGNTTVVRKDHLLKGDIKSCGCMHHKYGHGQTNTRLYHIWRTMKARCIDPNSVNDFTEFYKWANENGYDETLSIDRIDNNGNYCPENCRWVTAKEQANNTSSNVIIEYKGESETMSQMARKYGLKPIIVYKRLKRGWSIEKALETARITTFLGNKQSQEKVEA